MKLITLFAFAVTILVSGKTSTSSVKKNGTPVCCTKNKCEKELKDNQQEESFMLRISPFHI